MIISDRNKSNSKYLETKPPSKPQRIPTYKNPVKVKKTTYGTKENMFIQKQTNKQTKKHTLGNNPPGILLDTYPENFRY